MRSHLKKLVLLPHLLLLLTLPNLGFTEQTMATEPYNDEEAASRDMPFLPGTVEPAAGPAAWRAGEEALRSQLALVAGLGGGLLLLLGGSLVVLGVAVVRLRAQLASTARARPYTEQSYDNGGYANGGARLPGEHCTAPPSAMPDSGPEYDRY